MKQLLQLLQYHALNPTVGFAIDGALVEGHDVLRQRPCLVTENVLNLAQLLVQSSGTSFCWRVVAIVIHFSVPVDVKTVSQANNLHTAKTKQKNQISVNPINLNILNLKSISIISII